MGKRSKEPRWIELLSVLQGVWRQSNPLIKRGCIVNAGVASIQVLKIIFTVGGLNPELTTLIIKILEVLSIAYVGWACCSLFRRIDVKLLHMEQRQLVQQLEMELENLSQSEQRIHQCYQVETPFASLFDLSDRETTAQVYLNTRQALTKFRGNGHRVRLLLKRYQNLYRNSGENMAIADIALSTMQGTILESLNQDKHYIEAGTSGYVLQCAHKQLPQTTIYSGEDIQSLREQQMIDACWDNEHQLRITRKGRIWLVWNR